AISTPGSVYHARKSNVIGEKDLPIADSPRPRDRSVVLSLHCMNDPHRRVTWQATSDDGGADFARASKTPATSRARTSRSCTASLRIKMTGYRSWRLNWLA